MTRFHMYSARTSVRILVALLVVYATLTPAASFAQSDEARSDAPVSELLEQIKLAIELVDHTEAKLDIKSLPPLSRITLNLKAVAEKKSGGGVNLWIVRFGTNVTEGMVQTISLTLLPPDGASRPPRSDRPNLSTILYRAIIQAAEAVDDAKLTPDLELRRLTATIRFGVSIDSEGALDIHILDIGGNRAREAIQEIQLEFSRGDN